MRFYDFPDAYDLFYTEQFYEDCTKFYKDLFGKKKYKDFLDCAVGTGQMLIPLAQMGYNVTGTDLSTKMVRRASQNFARNKLMATLTGCDFCQLRQKIKGEFDVVLCTGNSLGHVKNDQLLTAIQSMDSMIRPGGMIYIDSKNWDNIVQKKQRFYLFNPIIRDKGRINYVQVWDYRRDGSIFFNYLIFEEINDKIVSKRQFYEIYYPFSHETIIEHLTSLNYQHINLCKLGEVGVTDINKIDWYAITAEKPIDTGITNRGI